MTKKKITLSDQALFEQAIASKNIKAAAALIREGKVPVYATGKDSKTIFHLNLTKEYFDLLAMATSKDKRILDRVDKDSKVPMMVAWNNKNDTYCLALACSGVDLSNINLNKKYNPELFEQIYSEAITIHLVNAGHKKLLTAEAQEIFRGKTRAGIAHQEVSALAKTVLQNLHHLLCQEFTKEEIRDNIIKKIKDRTDVDESLNTLLIETLDALSLEAVFTYYAAIKSDIALEMVKSGTIAKNQYLIDSTPITFSIVAENILLLKTLFEYGFDVNQIDAEGYTPLTQSIKLNQHEALQMLLDHPEIDVNKPNKAGQTPFMLATSNLMKNTAVILVSHQAFKRNAIQGIPYISMALQSSSYKAAEFLIEELIKDKKPVPEHELSYSKEWNLLTLNLVNAYITGKVDDLTLEYNRLILLVFALDLKLFNKSLLDLAIETDSNPVLRSILLYIELKDAIENKHISSIADEKYLTEYKYLCEQNGSRGLYVDCLVERILLNLEAAPAERYKYYYQLMSLLIRGGVDLNKEIQFKKGTVELQVNLLQWLAFQNDHQLTSLLLEAGAKRGMIIKSTSSKYDGKDERTVAEMHGHKRFLKAYDDFVKRQLAKVVVGPGRSDAEILADLGEDKKPKTDIVVPKPQPKTKKPKQSVVKKPAELVRPIEPVIAPVAPFIPLVAPVPPVSVLPPVASVPKLSHRKQKDHNYVDTQLQDDLSKGEVTGLQKLIKHKYNFLSLEPEKQFSILTSLYEHNKELFINFMKLELDPNVAKQFKHRAAALDSADLPRRWSLCRIEKEPNPARRGSWQSI